MLAHQLRNPIPEEVEPAFGHSVASEPLGVFAHLAVQVKIHDHDFAPQKPDVVLEYNFRDEHFRVRVSAAEALRARSHLGVGDERPARIPAVLLAAGWEERPGSLRIDEVHALGGVLLVQLVLLPDRW